MGMKIALSGILVVFAGLVMIAFVITVFNRISMSLRKRKDRELSESPARVSSYAPTPPPAVIPGPNIPEDDLIAITAAVELYRKIHFETLPSEITFVHGEDAQNAWKMGNKFGQRQR